MSIATAQRGVVTRVNAERDFGWIEPASGRDVFFHASALTAGLVFDELLEGRRIMFDATVGNDGRPRATSVRPL